MNSDVLTYISWERWYFALYQVLQALMEDEKRCRRYSKRETEREGIIREERGETSK